MKKISIVILAVFFIGIANVNAQSEATTETVVGIEEVKEVKKKGYSNAFIVAFNGDKKITISEALRLLK